MKITFADKNLDKRAKQFITRLYTLCDATTLEDVRNLPDRFHELTGNRKGKWGCELDHPYRLVFIPHETPIPSNADWYKRQIPANIPQRHNSFLYSGDEPKRAKR